MADGVYLFAQAYRGDDSRWLLQANNHRDGVQDRQSQRQPDNCDVQQPGQPNRNQACPPANEEKPKKRNDTAERAATWMVNILILDSR